MPIRPKFSRNPEQINITDLSVESPETDEGELFDPARDMLPSDWEAIWQEMDEARIDGMDFFVQNLPFIKAMNPQYSIAPSDVELIKQSLAAGKTKERLFMFLDMLHNLSRIGQDSFLVDSDVKNLINHVIQVKNESIPVLYLEEVAKLHDLHIDFKPSEQDYVELQEIIEKGKKNNMWDEYSLDAVNMTKVFPQFTVSPEDLMKLKEYELGVRNQLGGESLEVAMNIKFLDPDFSFSKEDIKQLTERLKVHRHLGLWILVLKFAYYITMLSPAPNLFHKAKQPIPTIKKF